MNPHTEQHISMAEALTVRAAINRKLNQLNHERLQNSSTYIEKGETAPYPQRTVDMITEEINQVMRDYRRLDRMIAISNTTNVISWDGEDLCILEAIELAKQLRAEIAQLTHLGSEKKLERLLNRSAIDGGNPIFKVALYDPEAYMITAQKLERQVTKLSALIERSNHLNTIPFDASAYMG